MASEERFAVVRKLMESRGWALDRVRGSHHVFVKSGMSNIIIPVHNGKVKPAYVRQIKKILKSD